MFAAEPYFEIGTGAGYRHDKMHFRFINMTDPFHRTVYIGDLKDLRGVEVGAYAKGNVKNIILLAEGDYVWIVSGKSNMANPIPLAEDAPGSIPIFFHTKNRGYEYDWLGSGGYQINFYNTEKMTFSLTPRGGYGFHKQFIRFRDTKPDPFVVDPSTLPPGFVSLSDGAFYNNLKTVWYGPFVAGDLALRFCKKWQITGSYAYHWLSFKFKQSPDFDLRLNTIFGGGFFFVTKFLSPKTDDAFGQTFQGRLDYLINNSWAVNLLGQYQIFKTKDFLTPVHGNNGTNFPNRPLRDRETDLFKLRRETFSILAGASYTY